MPAAGVEPAQNISTIVHFAVRANFRAKPIKKRAEHTPRPYEKSVHAVTSFSHNHIAHIIENVVSVPILCALLSVVKRRERALLRVRLCP